MAVSYFKGTVIGIVQTALNRPILVLEVNSIGYELQIPSRFARQIASDSLQDLQVFVHQQIRDDRMVSFGFASSAERDLFRELTSVSGVGVQLGVALIDTLGPPDLVEAIVTGDTKMLIKTPGVGKKTAERIALELKTKLAQWREAAGLQAVATSGALTPAIQEDLEMTLLALGYSDREIAQALSVLSQDPQLAQSDKAEDWIRTAITWLSQE